MEVQLSTITRQARIRGNGSGSLRSADFCDACCYFGVSLVAEAVGKARLTSQGMREYEVSWTLPDVDIGTELEYQKRVRNVYIVIVHFAKYLAYQDSLSKTFVITILHRLTGSVTQYQGRSSRLSPPISAVTWLCSCQTIPDNRIRLSNIETVGFDRRRDFWIYMSDGQVQNHGLQANCGIAQL
jgi:hypothetical protein